MVKFLIGLIIIVVGYIALPVTYTFSIGPIKETAYYNFMLYMIENVIDSNDTVKFKIYSPGGNAWYTMRIINVIVNSEAETTCYNQGVAASGGALIYFSCDNQIYDKYSSIMVHRAAKVIDGKRVLTALDSPINQIIHKYMDDKVFPRITRDQIIRYVRGEDVWFLSGEVR